MLEIIGGYLFIFFARVIDVSLATTRTLLIVRGRRTPAAIIGFFEILIYITALSRVVNSLSNPINLFVYALGFSTGNFVGSFIEEKMALGFLTILAIPKDREAEDLAENFRNEGFGVTAIWGEGREGARKILLISLRRRYLRRIIDALDELDPGAFMTIMDTRSPRGGVFQLRKGK